ncbi:hypothetical protein E4U60_001527 [Claviceps pazoutovae]|uniref:Uncharacterized protein n=1 Tax=Claviceps pazoutovae TaxID=1649127 RepID=A0A9P7SHU5_9HYPO|nr:hypothetical protein E4U60_001527 [Claviceps pazoutovae]
MIGAGFLNTRGRRLALMSIIVAIILVVALSNPQSYITSRRFGKHKDPTSPPPPIPAWNVAKKDLHKNYGLEDRPRPGDEDYKTLYEYALAELNTTLRSNDRWATRFFAYDTLTLVNRAAYDDVGGWDTYIPYYMTDCDMHSRLLMRNWTLDDRLAGIISDVSTTLKDLRVLYRDPSAEMGFMDPNPAAPEKLNETHDEVRTTAAATTNTLSRAAEKEDEGALPSDTWTSRLKYWQTLRETVAEMERYKHGSRGRNTWQAGQRGGQGEPYYYPARGVQMSFEMLTEAGRRIFAEKWGHRDCDLLREGGPRVEDQWRVAHDWE